MLASNAPLGSESMSIVTELSARFPAARPIEIGTNRQQRKMS